MLDVIISAPCGMQAPPNSRAMMYVTNPPTSDQTGHYQEGGDGRRDDDGDEIEKVGGFYAASRAISAAGDGGPIALQFLCGQCALQARPARHALAGHRKWATMLPMSSPFSVKTFRSRPIPIRPVNPSLQPLRPVIADDLSFTPLISMLTCRYSMSVPSVV